MRDLDFLEFEKRRRIIHWLTGKRALPYKLIFYPTALCNSKCVFCPTPSTIEKGGVNIKNELKEKEVFKIVEEGVKLKIKEWWITGGGEPFLSNKTLPMIEEIKKLDKTAYIMITTNGTLFTKEIIERLVEIGADRINFSLDGPTERIHDMLRNIKAFKKVIKAIKTLKKEKEKRKTDKPKIYINAILHSYNYDKLIQFVKVAKKIGCSGLILNELRVHPETKMEVERIKLYLDERKIKVAAQNYIKAKRLAQKLGIFFESNDKRIVEENSEIKLNEVTNTNNLTNEKERISKCYCFEPFLGMLIDSYGYVSPCCPLGGRFKELNIKNTSLEKIWFSKFFMELRESFAKGKSIEMCSLCDAKEASERLKKEIISHIDDDGYLEKLLVD